MTDAAIAGPQNDLRVPSGAAHEDRLMRKISPQRLARLARVLQPVSPPSPVMPLPLQSGAARRTAWSDRGSDRRARSPRRAVPAAAKRCQAHRGRWRPRRSPGRAEMRGWGWAPLRGGRPEVVVTVPPKIFQNSQKSRVGIKSRTAVVAEC